jgi:hypothetical protein
MDVFLANGLEFLVLPQVNLIAYVSRQVRFRQTGLVSESKQIKSYCYQIQWRQIRKAFYLLESTAFTYVRAIVKP